jgi:hypothetical protein
VRWSDRTNHEVKERTMNEKWEYTLLYLVAGTGEVIEGDASGLPNGPHRNIKEAMTAYGDAGWELAGVLGSTPITLIFKRRKT